jgi:hypothetical protein
MGAALETNGIDMGLMRFVLCFSIVGLVILAPITTARSREPSHSLYSICKSDACFAKHPEGEYLRPHHWPSDRPTSRRHKRDIY